MMIIDRFEGNRAACETDGRMVWLEKKLLPEGAKEGDVLVKTEKGYRVDFEATQKRREQVAKLMAQVFDRE